MPLALPYIIAAVATAVTVAVASPTINKCCAHGEILQPITLDCRPISTQKEREATWIPVVFSPARQNFLVSVPQEWKIEAPRRPSPCPSPMVHRADPAAPSFVLFANGSLVLPSPPLGLLHPDKFCLDAARESENTEMELAAIVCLPGKDPPVSSESIAPNPEEDNHAGVRKCCGDGAAFNGTANACAVDVTETGNWSAPRPLRTLAGFPLCSKGEFVLMEMELREPYASVSTEDGSLKLISSTVPPEEFCVERVVVHSKDGGADHAPVSPPRLFVCPGFIPTAAPADHHDLRYTLYPVGLIFSAFFLAATLAVGCLLPKAHHALHWRCQTGHVASLLVGYVLLAGTQIAGPSVKPGPCVALGLFMHYFFLAAFFWLNTMCFNIWWTFRNSPLSLIETLGAINNSVDHLFEEENPNVIMISKHRRAEQKNNMRLQLVLNDICLHVDPQDISQRDLRPASLDKGQELCRFRAYSLYAWGVPLLITGLGISLDLAATEKQKGGPLRPRFGELRCWFYGDMEIFAYFFGPVGVLLLVNLILFLATARELTCGLWRREVAKSSPHGEGADRATLGRVCLKLVVVMGVTWVADVISWAVGGPSHVWYATDLINAFQGVLIFAVVGCQPQVWTAIRRMWCFRGVGGNGGHRRRELGDRAVHDDDDDYDESGAVGRFCRGGAGGGVTSSGRPVSSTTSEAGPLGSSPPHSLTWEGEVSHRENSIHRNANSAGIKPNEKQLVEDKETLC